MPEYDTFDLPEDTIRNYNPVVEELSLSVWPNKRLNIGLGYNNASDEWYFAVGLNGYGLLIPPKPAKMDLPYGFRDYIRVIFHDDTEGVESVTTQGLASSTEVMVWPGPESSEYVPKTTENRIKLPAEIEPWREVIGFDRTTDIVETPLTPEGKTMGME